MTKKSGCLISFSAFALGLVCVAAVAAVVLLSPRVTHPSVQINSPRNAARVSVDQATLIQAIARDDQKIKRVELWVNDKLQDAQDTNVPGGISPFPLTMTWRPAISGTHTVIVRAFNAQGARSHATISVQAMQSTDRDNDGVADSTDACPDQPGTTGARGCPDRDGDGVRDADDACPDQAGLSAQRGCPAPSAQDRDGDGLLDSADACPDQPGSPGAQGCPDADGDGVRDSADACPREPGDAQNGCPTPGDADGDGVPDASDACPRAPGRPEFSGCADDDGDGIPDRLDACPRERGSAQLAGCPDRDNDGVRDAFDLCPITPGPASNSGCPVSSAGDGDGDGVHDDVDLAPTEAGPADQGGSPAPGRGADRNGNRIPDDVEPPRAEVRVFGVLTIPRLDVNLPALIPGLRRIVPKVPTTVEIEAVTFRVVGGGSLSDISCYIILTPTLFDEDGRPYYPDIVIPAHGQLNLDPGEEEREWNLPEVLGEQAARNFPADTDGSVRIQVFCEGVLYVRGETPQSFDLGVVDVTHASRDWDGHVMSANSSGGTDGRRFHVEYRLCQGSCEEATYRPPVIEMYHDPNGAYQSELRWFYPADLIGPIRTFGIYRNGSVVGRQSASEPWTGGSGWTPAGQVLFHYPLPSGWQPACGESDEYYVTAYGGDGRESPPSNTVTWNGPACPRAVRVTFESLAAANLGGDERDYDTVGPITGVFWASANDRRELNFHMSSCCDICYCSRRENRNGLRLSHNATYQIQSLFDWVHTQQASCLGNGCASNSYRAPEINYVTLMLGGDDDLSFGGTVQDVDWGSGSGSEWDTLFETSDRVSVRDLTPGVPITRTLSNRSIQITVRIEMLRE